MSNQLSTNYQSRLTGALLPWACLALLACGEEGSQKPQMDAGMNSKDAQVELEAECGRIPSAFPFESKYIEVMGSKMHYIEQGSGDPILFLHGNPTWSYLWRNIVPKVSEQGRAIAVDLIGMGRSDQPEIDYRFQTHAQYLEQFINQLNLDKITLVVHDWGSALGLDYAARHPEKIKALVVMEAMVEPQWPAKWSELPKPIHDFFQWIRNDPSAQTAILEQNSFVEQTLPGFAICPLSSEAHDFYREPYPTPKSRKPVWVWPNEVTIEGTPADVVARIDSYNAWMRQTELPKLLLWAEPGALINQERAEWLGQNWKNTKVVKVGSGLHFIQESNPTAISAAISSWYQNLH